MGVDGDLKLDLYESSLTEVEVKLLNSFNQRILDIEKNDDETYKLELYSKLSREYFIQLSIIRFGNIDSQSNMLGVRWGYHTLRHSYEFDKVHSDFLERFKDHINSRDAAISRMDPFGHDISQRGYRVQQLRQSREGSLEFTNLVRNPDINLESYNSENIERSSEFLSAVDAINFMRYINLTARRLVYTKDDEQKLIKRYLATYPLYVGGSKVLEHPFLERTNILQLADYISDFSSIHTGNIKANRDDILLLFLEEKSVPLIDIVDEEESRQWVEFFTWWVGFQINLTTGRKEILDEIVEALSSDNNNEDLIKYLLDLKINIDTVAIAQTQWYEELVAQQTSGNTLQTFKELQMEMRMLLDETLRNPNKAQNRR